VAQPLPEHGAQGTFTRITSRLRSSTHPDVLVLHKPRPTLPSQAPPPSSVDTGFLGICIPLPRDANLDFAKALPPTSLIHLPGRPLTIADIPPSQTLANADLPSPTPEAGTPYQRRFITQPLLLPTYETRSASARQRTSPEWHTKLLPGEPRSLRRGKKPLLSTSRPFSVISAILGSFNSGQDTVRTFWKQAEAYLLFAWN